jgi:hypothetical protein
MCLLRLQLLSQNLGYQINTIFPIMQTKIPKGIALGDF